LHCAAGKALTALLLAALGVCAMFATSVAAGADMAAPHFTGRVWDVAAARFIDAGTLVQRARGADIVLLGETHDHPGHHALEQSMFAALMVPAQDTAPVRSLVMEQYDLDQQPLLDAARSASNTDDMTLQQLGQLMGRGWDWDLYRPLVAAAVRAGVPISAANLPRPALQQVARTGFVALGSGEAQRLALETGWTLEQQALLEKNILVAHCGALPVSAAPAVARAQRARDAVMADRLLAATARIGSGSGAGPVLGIFGREHARRDLAVPFYLAARAPKKTVISIGLVEIDEGAAPETLALVPLGPLHDYLVLTAPMQRALDPCAGLVMPALPAR
jgi:uncharacterized iron-regulated protein